MKRIFVFVYFAIAAFVLRGQGTECIVTPYKNYQTGEQGTIYWAFHEGKTLLINEAKGQQSTVLWSQKGMEVVVPKSKLEIKSEMIKELPTPDSRTILRFPVKYYELSLGEINIHVWATRKLAFEGSQHYWAFLGEQGKSVVDKIGNDFPMAFQIYNSQNQLIYEQIASQELNLNLPNNFFEFNQTKP